MDADADGFASVQSGGQDCDDSDAEVYPGAAYHESDSACMRDADHDGWGDQEPGDGIEPGLDCDDEHDQTFRERPAGERQRLHADAGQDG